MNQTNFDFLWQYIPAYGDIFAEGGTHRGYEICGPGDEVRLLFAVSAVKNEGKTVLWITETDEKAKIVFIGPCTAKKAEAQLETVKPYVDAVLTFEELQALYDSRGIDITALDEDVLDNASYFGRIFARSGGLTDAVKQGLIEQKISFELKPIACDGIDECRIALLKKSKNVLDANFIEGMACVGGCIGGAGCLTHGEKNKAEVDKYGREALEKNITDAISVL